MRTLQRAVFLDRDGTLIKERDFISSTRQVKFIKGITTPLKQLRQAGYKLVIITNQSGVARGIFSETTLRRINQYIRDKLRKDGIIISRIYYCPHHPDGIIAKYRRKCDCRKPAPGMLHRARRELGVNLKKSWVIGDDRRDIICGKKVGAKTILVLTGKGRKTRRTLKPDEHRMIDFIAPDINAASEWILTKEQ